MIRRFPYSCDTAQRWLSSRDSWIGVLWLAAVAGLLIAMLMPGLARAETLAGVRITNAADLRYALDGTAQSITSNTVTLIVAERLDVRLARTGEGKVPVPTGSLPTAVPFVLTNLDNGNEAFVVSAQLASPTITLQRLAIDSDGDGAYDPAKDAAIVDGQTPILAPGRSLTVFAILSATGSGGDTTLSITARAVTGSGTAGTTYAGQGDGEGDAVVGPTGAVATLDIPLTTSPAGPVLLKSQSVQAADGSRSAVRDSVITYSLEARFTDAVTGARIADAIPNGTVFVPGSLVLDGAPLSDGADDDAGRFETAGPQGPDIAVALGRVAAGSVHIVQFKAKIQ